MRGVLQAVPSTIVSDDAAVNVAARHSSPRPGLHGPRQQPKIASPRSQLPSPQQLSRPQIVKTEQPPQWLKNFTFRVVNSLRKNNAKDKAAEMKGQLHDKRWYPWLALYLARHIVAEPIDLQPIYCDFLDSLDAWEVEDIMVKTLSERLRVLLHAVDQQSAVHSKADRKILRSIGVFLGRVTLGRSKPLDKQHLDLKALLLDGYEKGKLSEVLPLCKILAGIQRGSVHMESEQAFTSEIMSLLAEIYDVPNLRMNLRLDVQLLCQRLGIDLGQVRRSDLLKGEVTPLNDNDLIPPRSGPLREEQPKNMNDGELMMDKVHGDLLMEKDGIPQRSDSEQVTSPYLANRIVISPIHSSNVPGLSMISLLSDDEDTNIAAQGKDDTLSNNDDEDEVICVDDTNIAAQGKDDALSNNIQVVFAEGPDNSVQLAEQSLQLAALVRERRRKEMALEKEREHLRLLLENREIECQLAEEAAKKDEDDRIRILNDERAPRIQCKVDQEHMRRGQLRKINADRCEVEETPPAGTVPDDEDEVERLRSALLEKEQQAADQAEERWKLREALLEKEQHSEEGQKVRERLRRALLNKEQQGEEGGQERARLRTILREKEREELEDTQERERLLKALQEKEQQEQERKKERELLRMVLSQKKQQEVEKAHETKRLLNVSQKKKRQKEKEKMEKEERERVRRVMSGKEQQELEKKAKGGKRLLNALRRKKGQDEETKNERKRVRKDLLDREELEEQKEQEHCEKDENAREQQDKALPRKILLEEETRGKKRPRGALHSVDQEESSLQIGNIENIDPNSARRRPQRKGLVLPHNASRKTAERNPALSSPRSRKNDRANPTQLATERVGNPTSSYSPPIKKPRTTPTNTRDVISLASSSCPSDERDARSGDDKAAWKRITPLALINRVGRDARIYFGELNPKRPGTKVFERYEKYKKAQTVGQMLEKGATTADVKQDLVAGIVTLQPIGESVGANDAATPTPRRRSRGAKSTRAVQGRARGERTIQLECLRAVDKQTMCHDGPLPSVMRAECTAQFDTLEPKQHDKVLEHFRGDIVADVDGGMKLEISDLPDDRQWDLYYFIKREYENQMQILDSGRFWSIGDGCYHDGQKRARIEGFPSFPRLLGAAETTDPVPMDIVVDSADGHHDCDVEMCTSPHPIPASGANTTAPSPWLSCPLFEQWVSPRARLPRAAINDVAWGEPTGSTDVPSWEQAGGSASDVLW